MIIFLIQIINSCYAKLKTLLLPITFVILKTLLVHLTLVKSKVTGYINLIRLFNKKSKSK